MFNRERSNLIEQIGDFEIKQIKTDSDNDLVYSIYSEEEEKTQITYTYMNTEIECLHDWIRFKGNNHAVF